MGRTRSELMNLLPADRRTKVEARTRELVEEVESLHELRRLAQRSQEQMADALGVKQPSVHKIERQTDLYLSTLRRFVEAAGGTLELRVELPGKGPLRLTGVGDLRGGGRIAQSKRAAPAAVAEERIAYSAGPAPAAPEGAPAAKTPRRRRGRGHWKTPTVRKLKAGEAEMKPGWGNPALQAS